MADKNALLARIFDARMLRQAAGNVTRHRLTDLRDPWTGDIPRYARVRLDCLDGQHDACETCACHCHEEAS